MNSRAILYVAGAVSLAAIVGLLVLTTAPTKSPPQTEPAPSVAAASPPPPPPIAATTTSSSAVAKPIAAPSVAAASSQPELDPELDDSWKLLSGNAPPGAGDPFEDTETGEPMGKLLGKVGAIRYGVLRKDTTVTNEAAVAAIMRRAALDIDKLDRGRTDQPHKRMPEYEALLKKLREELRPHMTGSVMVAGQGWALATDVNEK